MAPATIGNDSASEQQAIRIWKLQYGPCWHGAIPSETDSFDFVRMRTTQAGLGGLDENILIVSERVIDGARQVYLQVHSDVPEPKLVVATAACPVAQRFWDDLPVGWTPVDEVLPVDIHVEECINGNPESLMAAVVEHVLTAEVAALIQRGDDAVSLEAIHTLAAQEAGHA
jgi:Ni,Fe-hydrogenase III small subunit